MVHEKLTMGWIKKYLEWEINPVILIFKDDGHLCRLVLHPFNNLWNLKMGINYLF